MTRYTNFGRKRTYVEAGFDNGSIHNDPASTAADIETPEVSSGTTESATLKPKRKRAKKAASANDAHDGSRETAEGHPDRGDPIQTTGEASNVEAPKKKSAHAAKKLQRLKAKKKAQKDANARKESSESRRLKRIAEKNAALTCFACRERGHAAADCPKAGESSTSQGATTGICYRCGSSRHTLSRCRKTADPENPLPFASCFVCSGKGHLASTCPSNAEKGIYPNGGCCKLCSQKTHLARDCPLRKAIADGDQTKRALMVGTGKGAGADEDDFLALRAVDIEVDREEKARLKAVKRKLTTQTTAHPQDTVVPDATLFVGGKDPSKLSITSVRSHHSGLSGARLEKVTTKPKKVVYF
ncbi:hypothetical protein PUNSTDRAFT_83058 [Punctularia strigosozonata HHB-11173 SS5]|uniref:uncharacterized protein n=1 Tax=Punctularia strigosozonata (strain HHB-11173) TaxID=741275 RepID=UPI00044176D8|nr:uncharacterized protein PUNSTDRAFT_83058 [Punctularia strigosozonata HHB-11173 SS5]EIN11442.1 hypothetical protein PUNSTDRAFT_83058 [Punctularia strigosozonata HHB-11173 SS5]